MPINRKVREQIISILFAQLSLELQISLIGLDTVPGPSPEPAAGKAFRKKSFFPHSDHVMKDNTSSSRIDRTDTSTRTHTLRPTSSGQTAGVRLSQLFIGRKKKHQFSFNTDRFAAN